MAAIALQVLDKIASFNAQGLANTAWAFAMLGIKNQPLMAAIAVQVIEKIDSFTAQNLAITAWAFAKLGIKHQALMAAIAAKVIEKVASFTAQGLAITAWAFAMLEIATLDLFTAIYKSIKPSSLLTDSLFHQLYIVDCFVKRMGWPLTFPTAIQMELGYIAGRNSDMEPPSSNPSQQKPTRKPSPPKQATGESPPVTLVVIDQPTTSLPTKTKKPQLSISDRIRHLNAAIEARDVAKIQKFLDYARPKLAQKQQNRGKSAADNKICNLLEDAIAKAEQALKR